MLRQLAIEKGLSESSGFRWRGGEVSRIEGFSDAVFAFAITLLVVSLEVPKSFTELLNLLRDVPAFAICFTMVIGIWHAHYTYFRRYGLHDNYTVVLNAILLFVVLLYIYPLKFLFSWLIEPVFDLVSGEKPIMHIEMTQVPQLMIVYSLGYFAVFITLLLMHFHAWRLRGLLSLTALERQIVKGSLFTYAAHTSISIISIGLAIPGDAFTTSWAGLIYMLVGPVMAVHGRLHGRTLARIRTQETLDPAPGDDS